MQAVAVQRKASIPGVRVLTTIGAVMLVVQGVAAAVTEQNKRYAGSTGDVLSDGLLAAGLILTLAGLEALRRVLSSRTAALAMAGQIALVVAILATVAAGRELLDGVFIVGTLAWLVGLTGIAVAAARARQRRWRAALALPLTGLVALAFTDAGGAVLLGLIWLVLAIEGEAVGRD